MAATARIKTLNHTSSWFEKTGGPDGAAIALAFMGWRWGLQEWRRAAEKTAGAGGDLALRAVAAGRCVVRPLICRKTAEPGTNWKAHQAQLGGARRAANAVHATRDAIDAPGLRQDSSARQVYLWTRTSRRDPKDKKTSSRLSS